MREAYHSELELVSSELAQMCMMVGRAMSLATRSLMDTDLELAEEVIAGDARVDALGHEIDERCYLIAAQQQPVATDLRVVMSGMRMSSSLERMGDLAKHVAKQTRLRYPKQVLPPEVQPIFAEMGTVAEVIVTKTASVILTRDVHLAPDIKRHDEQMNRLHRDLFGIVLGESWEHGVEAAIDITLLSRFYERFADHAVTIARRVVHIVSGEPYAEISLDPDPTAAAPA